MYVFVYILEDGKTTKSYRCKPDPTKPQAAVATAAAEYISLYVEEFGCDFDDAIIKMYGEACELNLVSSDGGQDALIYFSIHKYEDGSTPGDDEPKATKDGWVEYQGAAYYYDWSGDLASAPIISSTNEPDYGMATKVCDYETPQSDAVSDRIMELIA